jgi:hypothetical protein
MVIRMLLVNVTNIHSYFQLFAKYATATTRAHNAITINISPVITLSVFVIPLMYWLQVIIRNVTSFVTILPYIEWF